MSTTNPLTPPPPTLYITQEKITLCFLAYLVNSVGKRQERLIARHSNIETFVRALKIAFHDNPELAKLKPVFNDPDLIPKDELPGDTKGKYDMLSNEDQATFMALVFGVATKKAESAPKAFEVITVI